MIHLRVVSPGSLSLDLLTALRQDEGVLNLVVHQNSAEHPRGDSIHFDVLNGAANEVFARLRSLGIVEQGSIVAEPVNAWLSEEAVTAERRQSRFEAFTPIWELIDARIRSDGVYPPSWYGLLVIAGLIAAIGILINSQILIVAAMVVGPEYGAITSVARGWTKKDWGTAARGLAALAVGFSAAIVASLLLGEIIQAVGKTPQAYELGVRPVSNLINTPNIFSVIVAVLAGIVGIISLTEARASTLIGVFVSVTTIPAAADIGLSVSYGSWSEARGSTIQLLLNVAILIVVGAIMLLLQKLVWDRASARAATRHTR